MFIASLVAGVQLSGDIDCPDLPAVEQRLATLLSAPEEGAADRATISADETGFLIQLWRSDGSLVGSRTLPRKDSCEESAEGLAVVIAAWESQIRAVAKPPIGLPDPQPAPVSPPPIAIPAAALVAPRPPRAGIAWAVDAGFLGSVAGNAFAAGAAAEVYLGKKRFRLGARIGLEGMDTRDVPVGSGHVSYARFGLIVAPTVEVLSKVVRLEIHADAIAGWLFLQGHGFTNNSSDNSFDPALGGGLRASIDRWAVAPWIDVTLLGWLFHQSATAMVAGIRDSAEIPRFDVWLRVGISYGRRR